MRLSTTLPVALTAVLSFATNVAAFTFKPHHDACVDFHALLNTHRHNLSATWPSECTPAQLITPLTDIARVYNSSSFDISNIRFGVRIGAYSPEQRRLEHIPSEVVFAKELTATVKGHLDWMEEHRSDEEAEGLGELRKQLEEVEAAAEKYEADWEETKAFVQSRIDENQRKDFQEAATFKTKWTGSTTTIGEPRPAATGFFGFPFPGTPVYGIPKVKTEDSESTNTADKVAAEPTSSSLAESKTTESTPEADQERKDVAPVEKKRRLHCEGCICYSSKEEADGDRGYQNFELAEKDPKQEKQQSTPFDDPEMRKADAAARKAMAELIQGESDNKQFTKPESEGDHTSKKVDINEDVGCTWTPGHPTAREQQPSTGCEWILDDEDVEEDDDEAGPLCGGDPWENAAPQIEISEEEPNPKSRVDPKLHSNLKRLHEIALWFHRRVDVMQRDADERAQAFEEIVSQLEKMAEGLEDHQEHLDQMKGALELLRELERDIDWLVEGRGEGKGKALARSRVDRSRVYWY